MLAGDCVEQPMLQNTSRDSPAEVKSSSFIFGKIHSEELNHEDRFL